MTWFGWVFVVIIVIEQLGFIAEIDKDRKPRTREQVIASVLLNALLIWGAVTVGTTA